MVDRPLLNPVLKLRVDPKPEARTGGGKGRASVVLGRLSEQMRVLGAASRALTASRAQLPTFERKTHLVARMFAEDSLAPSHTPDDLFHPLQGCQLVAPLRHGYLIEVDVGALERLTYAIEHPASFKLQADVSRVKALVPFSLEEKLRGHSAEELWNAALQDADGARLFILWLAPFKDHLAQTSLLTHITKLAESGVIQPTMTQTQLPLSTEAGETRPAAATERQSSISRAMRTYRASGAGRATVRVSSPEALSQLLASGASYRIDPVRKIGGAQPGIGQHPDIPVDLTDAPVVGVIDGGLHAPSYTPTEAWRAAPLVPNAQADRNHGSSVSSLVVHAHAWNNNRPLPKINCRIGSVQAVPARNSTHHVTESALVDHIAQVFRDHPDTRVWNISANQDGTYHPTNISYLGHEIGLLARQFGVLPVISIGNVSAASTGGTNSPADCEAAIAVSGRQATTSGGLGAGCPVCLTGPGPDGMMKPDLSWYSELRMLGGVTAKGSSYAAPLVSSVAAHTFAKLREPSPDLVKALLINKAEQDSHDPHLGWGTPYHGASPWECQTGSVTLAWRAKLRPGAAYYWNDLPIPPEMILGGKLSGRGRLTAILNPLVSPQASSNYFSTRLETALQFPKSADKWDNLLGTMQESSLTELEARGQLSKWQPVRCHSKEFDGLNFSGNHFRLYARVYSRDLYQYGFSHQSEIGPQEVAFVLTLWSADGADTIHDSTVRALGNFVESAVIHQDINISN